MYESYVKRMSFSSGTVGGLGGFQLICTAGCLSPITCTQERPFPIASNKSPYLPSSQYVSMGGVHAPIFLPITFFIADAQTLFQICN